uniref:Glycosyltransferase RgtA/B/C/D-like domain-containing protein n=1 Tax=uncultured marine thaumarchaeote AD1000_80_F03 TaxID=1455943 RepID=A0A075G439_9ARCH|nr:hypothetical protein [uncultured marine thaumarchaeote AD1000_80_F03]
MSQMTSKNLVTALICIFSIIIVGISLVSVIFPALITTNFGIQESESNQFEIGSNTITFLIGNLLLIGFGILYFKKKLPVIIQKSLENFLNKNISNKTTIILLFIILIPYVILTIPELFLDESEQTGDYYIFLAAKETFPFGQINYIEAVEQNDRYVRMILLLTSLEILGNVKIIPFLGSIALLLTTYVFTKQITNNRLAGIIAMLVLIQSYTFLKYDSFAMYENFWVLFYVLSLYAIYKKWQLSSVSYILSIFTKTFTAIFLPLSLVYVYYAKIKLKTKILLVISYAAMFGVVISVWYLDSSVYSSIIRFDIEQLFIGFTKLSYQLRFDLLLLTALFPLTIALIIKAKNGISIATPVLFLIAGSLVAGPIIEIFSGFYVTLPYRFIPTIVFFAIGVGILFNKKSID